MQAFHTWTCISNFWSSIQELGGQQRLLIYELVSSPWCSSCRNAQPQCSLFVLLARIILMGSGAFGCCWLEYERTLLLLSQSMSIFTLGAVLAFGPVPGHHYYWALTLNTITLTKVCTEKITFSQTNIFNLALMHFWQQETFGNTVGSVFCKQHYLKNLVNITGFIKAR